MTSDSNINEIERITQRIAAINLEKQQLEQRLDTLQNIVESNKERNADTPKVRASDLYARTGVHIPPKYHRFANIIRKDKQGERIYVGDQVEISTKGSRAKQVATVAYLTEYKVTVIYDNGVKSSRESSLLLITKLYDRKGLPL